MIVLILVYAKNNRIPALYGYTTVVVKVLDANDHAPVFSAPSYNLNVPENEGVRLIHVVRAMDTDIGLNSQISYYITGILFDILKKILLYLIIQTSTDTE